MDADGDGFTPEDGDCDDNDDAIFPGASEVCNAVDDNCDGAVDEGVTAMAYRDADGDGFGDPADAMPVCSLPIGYVASSSDCDDTDPTVKPGGIEVCDGQDNDCDDAIDESAIDRTTYYADNDGDGYGDASSPMAACELMAGYSDNASDCDDDDSAVHPAAEELCDGIDNDCDAATDEGAASDATIWYRDMDGDGYGDSDISVARCMLPVGYIEVAGDCDDGNAEINPGAEEICDGIDNDCDASTTDDFGTDAVVWYVDMDGDGFGSDSTTVTACAMPLGYADNADDCHDGSMLAYPGGTEVCDGIDNDCDGETDGDDATDRVMWYLDADDDGFGDAGVGELACEAPDGFVADDTDCDDTTDEAAPDAVEVCDGMDNDCNGMSDELDECGCDLASVSSPEYFGTFGNTWGAWMQDPLETLGEGLVWEMEAYDNQLEVRRFPSIGDMSSRSSITYQYLSYGYDGTGHVVYDGYLYYNEAYGPGIRKVDLATMAEVDSLTIPGAGYRNTYSYQWGGYSDIDLAVDEDGLWVIYATSANDGRLVLSKIDVDTFSITDTWNTDSDSKTSIGNAFMICGKLYATGSYSSPSTTINFKFDPETGEESNPGIPIENPGGYNSSIDYNPLEQKLYSWDHARRQRYDLTFTE